MLHNTQWYVVNFFVEKCAVGTFPRSAVRRTVINIRFMRFKSNWDAETLSSK